MNEELRIIISAQVDKLKAGCKQATEAIDGIDKEGKETSKNSEKHFSNMGDAAKKAGATIAKGLAVGFAAAAAGVVAITKSAVEAYSEYEQLVGGVDTLFKDSSDKVQKYASEAYKTAGMSANEYMSMATTLSASMISSLEGDVNKAADSIDVAMRDIADNANKMGTPIESLQNAYQGFAKQNYTMLDNLKLGYGGTKEEMERLLADAEKLTGVKYDISSLSDVSAAIHAIQTEMGITGTTAKEAASTIQGSSAMMKSSWQNLLVGLADENANFDELLANFIESVGAFASNLIPRIQVALGGIVKLIQGLVPQIIEILPQLVSEIVPMVVEAAASIIDALAQALPGVIEAIVGVIPGIIEALANAIPTITGALLASLPLIIEAILQIASEVIVAIAEMLPTIIEQIVAIIPVLIETLIANIPVLLEAAIQLLMAIVDAIPVIIVSLVAALPSIIDSLITTLLENLPMVLNAGLELFNGIVEAIPQIIPVLIQAIPQIISSIIDFILGSIPMLLENAIQMFMALVLAIPEIIPQLITALAQIIGTIITHLVSKVPKLLGTIWDSIVSIFAAVPQFFAGIFKNAVALIKAPFQTIVSFFKGIWQGIKDIFAKVGGTIGDAIKNAVTSAVNKVLSSAVKIINGFISAINIAIGVINAIPGVSIKKISSLSVPKLAKGGIIDTATLAVVGEQGKEAVMPLENNLEWLDKLAGMLNARMGGTQPIYLMVDKRVLAQSSVEGINEITRATGTLPLVIV